MLPSLTTDLAVGFWRARSGLPGGWFGEDVMVAAARRFVRQVAMGDAHGFSAVRGRSVLYLANHQVAVESMTFNFLLSGLSGARVAALAKAEHAESWVGRLSAALLACPGVTLPPSM